MRTLAVSSRAGALVASAMVLSIAVHGTAVAAPAPCDLKLSVVFTPDVPNPSDTGFLSSLLNNNPGYRLTLVRSTPDSGVVLELTGAGPDDLCQNVLATIRKDSRVQSAQLYQPPPQT
jgi:hypothetical protein